MDPFHVQILHPGAQVRNLQIVELKTLHQRDHDRRTPIMYGFKVDCEITVAEYIREVKSTGAIRKGMGTKDKPLKEKYARDVEIQWWVASGCNIEIPSIELIYVDKKYKRPDPGFSSEDLFAGMEPKNFFKRKEIFREIRDSREDTQAEVGRYLRALSGEEPEVEPSKKLCSGAPGGLCDFWEQCTADKPDDWVDVLYYPRGKQITCLKNEGKNRLSDLAIEDGLGPEQGRMIRSVQADQDIIEETLGSDLRKIDPPAIHLDFEYLAGVALPIFAGTRPFEVVPFQFSAHRLNEDGSIDHIGEFLATGTEDPRQKFAEKLIALLDGTDEPIVAYNAKSAEKSVIEGLIKLYPELAVSLGRINARIEDVLIVFRDNVMLRQMITKESINGGGFFSLKNVAPAFVDGFTYDDLGVVSNGGAAMETFFQLITDEPPIIVEADGTKRHATKKELRDSLLAYCKKDTEATAEIHKKLLALTDIAPSHG